VPIGRVRDVAITDSSAPRRSPLGLQINQTDQAATLDLAIRMPSSTAFVIA
jgi:hypothetical protein